MNKTAVIIIFLIFLACIAYFWFTTSKSFFKSEDERSAKWDDYNKRFK